LPMAYNFTASNGNNACYSTNNKPVDKKKTTVLKDVKITIDMTKFPPELVRYLLLFFLVATKNPLILMFSRLEIFALLLILTMASQHLQTSC